MVEQTRQRSCVVSLQAGPSVAHNSLFDVDLRMNDRVVQTVGRQLAEIGDRLNREWTGRLPPLPPLPPSDRRTQSGHTLTRDLYRGIGGQLRGMRSWSAVKAWGAGVTSGQGTLRAQTWTAWVSSIQLATCAGWSTGLLAAAALVATAAICIAFWEKWKE